MITLDKEFEEVFYSEQCLFCKHYTGRKEDGTPTCEAYPDGIPRKFWNYTKAHDSKQSDQEGSFTFERKD